MSDVLERAKSLQHKVTSETSFWIKLDLFEALIAEIERLEAERPPASLKAVNQLASQRSIEQQKGPL